MNKIITYVVLGSIIVQTQNMLCMNNKEEHNDKKRSLETINDSENGQSVKTARFSQSFFDKIDVLIQDEAEFIKNDYIGSMKPCELDYCYAVARYHGQEDVLASIEKHELTPLMKSIENKCDVVEDLIQHGEVVSIEQVYIALAFEHVDIFEIVVKNIDLTSLQQGFLKIDVIDYILDNIFEYGEKYIECLCKAGYKISPDKILSVLDVNPDYCIPLIEYAEKMLIYIFLKDHSFRMLS